MKNPATTTEHFLPKQYADNLLVIDSGEGLWVRDRGGKEYLDFAAGIAVNSLGYGQKELAKLLAQQAEKLIHISNLFANQPSLDLAEKLCTSGNQQFAAVHFGNSGTEANEAAIKYARVWQKRKNRNAWKIIAFENSFHGRTMGALSLTWPDKYRSPFGPLLPGTVFAKYNNIDDLTAQMNNEVAAVIVEPVQGEGGLDAVTEEFATVLNQLCSQYGALLIADEVQTGIGRCASLFASDIVGLRPDIITLAKPLAAGLPLSATLITSSINDILQPGDHASTFGGGPVTTMVANYVWDTITAPGFLERVDEVSQYLEKCLSAIRDKYPSCFADTPVKGRGLLRGLFVKNPLYIEQILSSCLEHGLLLLRSGTQCLRFAPPLVVEKSHIDTMETILCTCLERSLDT